MRTDPEWIMIASMNLLLVPLLSSAALGAPGEQPVPGAVDSKESAEPFDLDKVHALLLPQEGEERWRSIPWITDLFEARKIASERGKPIFLWEMDGNPLGCT